jgi:hypothetical protein
MLMSGFFGDIPLIDFEEILPTNFLMRHEMRFEQANQKWLRVPVKHIKGSASGDFFFRDVLSVLNRNASVWNALSPEAVEQACYLRPIQVVLRDKRYEVIGNHQTALLLSTLCPKKRIPVVVWSQVDEECVNVMGFLALILNRFSLGSDLEKAIVITRDRLSAHERKWVSDKITTRSGLEDLTQVSRKLKISGPKIILTQQDQEGFNFDDEF